MKLTFREKGLSKKTKKRIWILLLIFLIALIFFYIVLNFNKTGTVTEMTAPTLPTISMEAMDQSVNELHGYTQEMDACYMRDALVPISSDRKLPITIQTNGAKVKNVSYEIRSLDTKRKIAETKIADWKTIDGTMTAEPEIENLIDQDEEYLFVITLKADGEKVCYYSRIIMPSNAHEKECLAFALQFHETSMSSQYTNLATYIETSEYSDHETLSEVTIQSGIDQIGWAGFQGKEVADPVIEIKDMNNDYCALVLKYQMKETNSAGKDIYYNVNEYFKIRYSAERMYLLDYDRTMEQVLAKDNIKVSENKVNLGVALSDVNYLSNETGEIVAFVQAGELYEYNQTTGEMTKVFSFITDDVTDNRQNYNEHNILLLNIDETGTMDYVVYGYMNAGEYEGRCGLDLYHYDSVTKTSKEQAFIEASSSYQILNAKFSDLLYKSSDGYFYIMMDGTLIQVDLDNIKTKEIYSGLSDDQYAVSSSGRYFAYTTEKEKAKTIHMRDLETNTESTIQAADGEYVKPLAFMDEDFVYGKIKDSDISTDVAGTQLYPMYDIVIQATGGNHEILKEYQKPGMYVTEVNKVGYTLYLTRAVKDNNALVITDTDTIKNSEGEKNKAVKVTTTAKNHYGKISQIIMSEISGKASYVKGKTASGNLVLAKKDRAIEVSPSEANLQYIVYVGSNVLYVGDDVTAAITKADEQMGIVINNLQQYIWKRGKKTNQNPLSGISVGTSDVKANSSAQCISAILNREGENVEVNTLLAEGETPVSILTSTLKKDTILNLTGASLTEVLYYVNLGNPVYARTGDNSAVLLVGYDTANVTVFDPSKNTTVKIGLNDATAKFEAAGNVFVGYITEE